MDSGFLQTCLIVKENYDYVTLELTFILIKCPEGASEPSATVSCFPFSQRQHDAAEINGVDGSGGSKGSILCLG